MPCNRSRTSRVGALAAIVLVALMSTAPAARSVCTGDCDGSGEVDVTELITLVNIALGNGGGCPNGVPDGASVDVGLIIQAVNTVLNGCPVAPPTATPSVATPATPTLTLTSTLTATATPTHTPRPTPSNTPAPSTFRVLANTLRSARSDHRATLLQNGQVLLTGGNLRAPSFGAMTTVVERYDADTRSFTTSGSWVPAREGHTATVLGDGKVLITGGFTDESGDLDTAAVYDPATGLFTALPATMTAHRTNHTATALQNGKVLLAGGAFHSGSAQNSAELYDPTTHTFTALGVTMRSRRQAHVAALLPNGHVLLTGGVDGCCDPDDIGTNLDTAEVYDPVANRFTALAATMTSARTFHAATSLPDGHVLLTGGLAGQSTTSFVALDTAELYDPGTGTFTALSARMTAARAAHTATLLADGHVLVAGGVADLTGSALNSAELYGP